MSTMMKNPTLTPQMKRAVEDALTKTRLWKQMDFEVREQRVTMLYEPRYHGKTNKVDSQVADIAIYNTDEPERRKQFIQLVESSVRRLGTIQRKIIENRYLSDDYVRDIDVALELGYSERQYRRYKAEALYRLATMLFG